VFKRNSKGDLNSQNKIISFTTKKCRFHQGEETINELEEKSFEILVRRTEREKMKSDKSLRDLRRQHINIYIMGFSEEHREKWIENL
jgi:hypothetical protein